MAKFKIGDKLEYRREHCSRHHSVSYCSHSSEIKYRMQKNGYIVYMGFPDTLHEKSTEKKEDLFCVDCGGDGEGLIDGRKMWILRRIDIDNFRKTTTKTRIMKKLKV